VGGWVRVCFVWGCVNMYRSLYNVVCGNGRRLVGDSMMLRSGRVCIYICVCVCVM